MKKVEAGGNSEKGPVIGSMFLFFLLFFYYSCFNAQTGSIFTNYALQGQKWAQITPDMLFGPCMVGIFFVFL